MVSKVVEAMVKLGFVDVSVYGATLNEGFEEVVNATVDRVNLLEEIEKLKGIVKEINQFKDVLEAELFSVTENGITRAATPNDELEFIREEFYKLEERLYDEFGIDLEQDFKRRSEEILHHVNPVQFWTGSYKELVPQFWRIKRYSYQDIYIYLPRTGESSAIKLTVKIK